MVNKLFKHSGRLMASQDLCLFLAKELPHPLSAFMPAAVKGCLAFAGHTSRHAGVATQGHTGPHTQVHFFIDTVVSSIQKYRADTQHMAYVAMPQHAPVQQAFVLHRSMLAAFVSSDS